MNSHKLILEQKTFNKQFYTKIENWFLKEMAKISEKHNVYIEDYGILTIYDFNNKESYEPYSIRYEEDRIKKFEIIVKEIEIVTNILCELDFMYQSYAYAKNHKFLR